MKLKKQPSKERKQREMVSLETSLLDDITAYCKLYGETYKVDPPSIKEIIPSMLRAFLDDDLTFKKWKGKQPSHTRIGEANSTLAEEVPKENLPEQSNSPKLGSVPDSVTDVKIEPH